MYNMHDQQRHITIRHTGPEHEEALRILAQRDSAPVPPGVLLLALAGDEPKAAISLSTGAVIADPFQPTEALVRLLQERARQLRAPSGLRARLAARRAPRRALSPKPAGTLRAFD